MIIPAYNEVATIAEIIRRVRQAPFEKEILIVDDASTDGTREYLEGLEDPAIRVFYHKKNKGKGAALRTAIPKATGDMVVIQDADLEYYPDEILRLTEKIRDGKADAVFGSRFIGARRVFMFYHYLGNKLANLLANVLYNTNLTDFMTCYKAFRRDVIQSLKLHENGFAVEAEITGKLFKQGFRVYEVPISYDGRDYDEGKKIRWADFFKVIFALIRGRVAKSETGLVTLEKTSKMRRYNQWILEKITPYLGREVLEIGAGIGNFSVLFRNLKRLVATDYDDYYLTRLKSRFMGHPFVEVQKLDLLAPAAPQSFTPASFDTAVCLNVLEHIKNESAALQNILTLLKPGGTLFLLVPAHEWALGTLDEMLGHYRRYTRAPLAELLNKEGFIVEQSFYFNPFSLIPWFISSRVFKKKVLSSFQSQVFDWAVPALKKLPIKNPSFGLSVIAIAKKSGALPVRH